MAKSKRGSLVNYKHSNFYVLSENYDSMDDIIQHRYDKLSQQSIRNPGSTVIFDEDMFKKMIKSVWYVQKCK